MKPLKRLTILSQVILALSLPFFAHVAYGDERPATQLTPYAISVLEGKLRESSENSSPLAHREVLRQDLQQYCKDHHLPFDVSDSIR
jgi:hypothetical protein